MASNRLLSIKYISLEHPIVNFCVSMETVWSIVGVHWNNEFLDKNVKNKTKKEKLWFSYSIKNCKIAVRIHNLVTLNCCLWLKMKKVYQTFRSVNTVLPQWWPLVAAYAFECRLVCASLLVLGRSTVPLTCMLTCPLV